MAEANRTCIICGKKYEYCPRCGKGSWDKKWMFVCCSENCVKINSIIMQYRSDYDLITKEEAKNKMLKLDLTNKDTFWDDAKRCIDEILAYENENNKLITDVSFEDIEQKEIEVKTEIVKEVEKQTNPIRRKRKSSRKKSVSTENISE